MVRLAGSILEQNVAIDAHFCGACRGLARVIGLRRALRQNDVRTLIAASASRNSSLRVLLPPVDMPVQSSRLIQISGPLSARAQIGHVFERCRQMGEANARETCKIHYLLTLKNGMWAGQDILRQFAKKTKIESLRRWVFIDATL